MGIFNRRNAFIGWLVWQGGKRVAKRKAKEALPTVDRGTKRPNRTLIVLALAGAGAAAFWWFRRGDSGDSGDSGESFGE